MNYQRSQSLKAEASHLDRAFHRLGHVAGRARVCVSAKQKARCMMVNTGASKSLEPNLTCDKFSFIIRAAARTSQFENCGKIH